MQRAGRLVLPLTAGRRSPLPLWSSLVKPPPALNRQSDSNAATRLAAAHSSSAVSPAAASIASTALSCLITEEKAQGMTVRRMARVNSRMRKVGRISRKSFRVSARSCLETHSRLPTYLDHCSNHYFDYLVTLTSVSSFLLGFFRSPLGSSFLRGY